MRLEGTYQFNAPRQAVWDALMDPTVLAQALPGGEELEKVGENEYKAAMNVRVGPVQGKFQGQIELADILPLEGYRMTVNGQGAPGFVRGEGVLQLADHDGGTALQYSGDVQIGGRIAGVSQRLVDSTAKSLTRQGLQTLDQHIMAQLQPAPMVTEIPPVAPESTGQPAASATAAQPVATPSTAGIAANVARDVAKDLAAEYIPANQQEKLFYAALGALGMLLFVVLVRLVQK